MRRRDFITVLSGAAAWPVQTFAQGAATPVIGFLHSGSLGSYGPVIDAFRRGIGEAGYVEGRTVTIEYRWAEDRFDRLPALAGELVRRKVSLIFAGGGELSALSAKAATSTIPIVFAIGADPVQHRIVASMNRPGGNVTGITFLVVQLRPKMVELTRELLPQAKSIAVIANPNRAGYEQGVSDFARAAKAVALDFVILKAGNEREIDAAFTTLASMQVDALLFLSDPVYIGRREQISRLALARKIPTIHGSLEHIIAGSLIAYGASLTDAVRQAGAYSGRILKGEKPADLPVMQPTKFTLAINLKTAKALGITVPPTLLARADEVIE
jgi:putative ABC transport system substrate-binding protein